VEREPAPEDRRVNRVRITATGKELILSVLPEQADVVQSMLSNLDDGEIETLRFLLEKAMKAT
jgi:DNA-binding MarR family transcriptional regulator